jgi:transcriptional regulator NrdR family protein
METKQLEITEIIKRDYETSPFVLNKISNAVEKAMMSVGNVPRKMLIISLKMFFQNY